MSSLSTCTICGASFKFSEVETLGSAFQMPTCDCEEKLFEVTQARERRKKMIARGLSQFERLGLGPINDYVRAIKRPGIWEKSEDAVEAARRGKSLVVHGSVGAHKTTLVKNIAGLLSINGAIVRGGRATTIMNKLKDFDDRSYYGILLEADVLVLDDIDKIQGSRYEMTCIFDLIDAFKQAEKAILATANHLTIHPKNFDAANADLLAAILSRLTDNATVIKVVGEDSRAQTSERLIWDPSTKKYLPDTLENEAQLKAQGKGVGPS
jgi:hypothetical protein